jgi:hypothetical protein
VDRRDDSSRLEPASHASEGFSPQRGPARRFCHRYYHPEESMSATQSPDTFTREDRSISMAQANLYGLLLLPPLLLLAVPFWLIWGGGALVEGLRVFTALQSFLPALVIGIVIHEALHGLAWMLAGRKPRSAMHFGFQLKTLTPYAHCTEPLEVGAYRVGAATPGVVLGLLPVLVATVIGNGWLLWFGVFFAFAAVGDLLILWLLRDVPRGRLVEDHPTRAGCTILEAAPVVS